MGTCNESGFAIGVVALIVIQTAAFAALFIHYRRCRRERIAAQKLYGELTHMERTTLAGRITASIAHEVTQPLSAILSNVETAELLLSRPNPDMAALREIVADIRRDDLRASEIVQNLRALLRRKELQFERTDINKLACDVLVLIRSDALRRGIDIQTLLEPRLPKVAADAVHLQQVLLNLLINAMDAMQDTPATKRTLTVRTHLYGHKCIEVAITDSGNGMTPEQLTQAFESFFTTKQQGMGLGLSIARSVVRAHGGRIWAEHASSGGTALRFTLPLKVRRRATPSPFLDSAQPRD
jgi:signal transduction histidine kinase